jgi:hypothetical protein
MNDEERVSLSPLKPTQALKALLGTEAEAPKEDRERCPKTWQGMQCSLPAGHHGPCRYDFPA